MIDFMNSNTYAPTDTLVKASLPELSTAIEKAIDPQDYYSNKLDASLSEECATYYNDPLGWVLWAFDWDHGELEGFLGADKWQIDSLNDIGKIVTERNFNGVDPVSVLRMATASGHGIGKSAFVAWLIMWLMSTRPFAKGIVTANTSDQLKTKTWGELGKWRSRCIIGHWFEFNSGRGSMSMYHKAFPETWRVDAQTCREENSEAFAGLHAASSSPFYIFDEASAVPDKIWEVAEGGLTDGEPHFYVFGNPTRNTGKFSDCFKGPASHRWIKRQIDSRTAKMTNKAQIAEWADDWGEDSDFFRVRVLGQFPKAGDMQLIPGDVVEEARRRDCGRYLGDDPLICGVDLARGGADNCMIQFRRGKDAKSEKVYRIPGEKSRDSMHVVSKLQMLFARHKPDQIFLDETGLGGPIVDRLLQLGYPVTGIGFGNKANDEKHYKNMSAEMWYKMRQWLLDGGSIPDDNQLEKELINREYWHNDKDQLVLQSKKDMDESPDWADALGLTFAQEVSPIQGGRGMMDAAIPFRGSSDTSDYNPLDGL